MSEQAQATGAAVEIPERNSLAFVMLVWRVMASDFRVGWTSDRDSAGRLVFSEGPHDMVSGQLATARWNKWSRLLDATSDVEIAMLGEISAANQEQLKERHRSFGLVIAAVASASIGLAQQMGSLDWVEPIHLTYAFMVVLILSFVILDFRLKAAELERCIRLAQIRRQARGGPEGEFDLTALAGDLGRLRSPHRRALIAAAIIVVLGGVAGTGLSWLFH